jgi:hypothetical protein
MHAVNLRILVPPEPRALHASGVLIGWINGLLLQLLGRDSGFVFCAGCLQLYVAVGGAARASGNLQNRNSELDQQQAASRHYSMQTSDGGTEEQRNSRRMQD